MGRSEWDWRGERARGLSPAARPARVRARGARGRWDAGCWPSPVRRGAWGGRWAWGSGLAWPPTQPGDWKLPGTQGATEESRWKREGDVGSALRPRVPSPFPGHPSGDGPPAFPGPPARPPPTCSSGLGQPEPPGFPCSQGPALHPADACSRLSSSNFSGPPAARHPPPCLLPSARTVFSEAAANPSLRGAENRPAFPPGLDLLGSVPGPCRVHAAVMTLPTSPRVFPGCAEAAVSSEPQLRPGWPTCSLLGDHVAAHTPAAGSQLCGPRRCEAFHPAPGSRGTSLDLCLCRRSPSDPAVQPSCPLVSLAGATFQKQGARLRPQSKAHCALSLPWLPCGHYCHPRCPRPGQRGAWPEASRTLASGMCWGPGNGGAPSSPHRCWRPEAVSPLCPGGEHQPQGTL